MKDERKEKEVKLEASRWTDRCGMGWRKRAAKESVVWVERDERPKVESTDEYDQ